jgi:nucleotide-binding universal stress UspA family protein
MIPTGSPARYGVAVSAIVVGYDGAEASRKALDRAIEEAQARSARVVVVSVAEMPLNPEGLQTFGTLDDSPPTMLPLVAPPELEAVLAEARDRVEAAGLTGDYVWAAGEPADAIVATARDRNAQLVVLGRQHHGFLERVLGTDVADEVERAAGCDVLVVD